MSESNQLFPPPIAEWVVGELLCGQCGASAGWGSWQELPQNALGVTVNTTIDMPRPTIYCSKECAEAGQIRHVEDQRAFAEKLERTFGGDDRTTILPGQAIGAGRKKQLVFKGKP